MLKRLFYFLLVTVLFLSCKTEKKEQTNSNSALLETFRFANRENIPQISAHRGGKSIIDYPENCLETLKYVSSKIEAIYEIDVAKTKDGKLVLMHDNAIDRTTTGTGLIKDKTYSELKNLYLVDDYGNTTTFKIPLFSDVLDWAKETNSVLTVDIKRSVPQEDVLKAIKNAKAEDVCIVITYDLEQAQSANKYAPELMLSVSARNARELEALLNSSILNKNMIAFTGTRLSNSSLYEKLHSEDILTMLGTLGNLDKQAEARGDELYLRWKKLGVDILATDRPFEAYKAID